MNWDELVHSPDVAGVAGAILGWLSAPGGTLKQQLFNMGAGIASAIWLAPLVAERVGMTSQSGRMAFAFLLGLVGMNLLPKLMQAAKVADWGSFLPRKGKS